MTSIPLVQTEWRDGAQHSVCAFALRSLECERLLAPSGQQPQEAKRLAEAYAGRSRLMALLARWQFPLVLELRLSVRPSLDPRQSGRTDIALLLRTSAAESSTALERALEAAVTFDALLPPFFRGAEFEAVTEPQRLRAILDPFQLASVLAVERRREPVALGVAFESVQGHGFHLAPDQPAAAFTTEHVFPWIPADDDWNVLLESLLKFPARQWLIARFVNRVCCQTEMTRLERAIAVCEQFLASGSAHHTILVRQAAALRDVAVARLAALRGDALGGAVLLYSTGPADCAMATLLGQSVSGDSDNPFCGGFRIRPVSLASEPVYCDSAPFTPDEAACAFRLPLLFDERENGLPVRRYRTLPVHLPPQKPGPSTLAGINCHRGVERPVWIDVPHRLRHAVLFGMTGCGKSTMLESMFLQDVRAGLGACLIDPHGDTADSVLARFPEERLSELIVIDFENRDRPIPLNLLAWTTIEERDRIVDDLYSALLRVYRNPDIFGPIFETHFRSGMKLLMGDRPDHRFTGTLLEFPKLFLSEPFRRFLAADIEDEQLRDFVTESERVSYGDSKLENLAPYITNKLGRFLHDHLLRRMLGHGAMALNFSDILQHGWVVVMKLGRGRFGALASDLITSQIVARFRAAAMARALLPAVERRPYFLYVDEFGALAGDETFGQLLAESRKYALGLVLASQYAAQLRRDDGVHSALSAVLGNVGTVVSFRVGAEDAPLLANVFAPMVGSGDLMECPNFHGYMRLHLNEQSVRPFSFRNHPDETVPDPARAARLVAASLNRWGVPAAECDERATRRARWIRELR